VRTVEQSSVIALPAAEVWERAVSEEGINAELAPILRMTMPADLRGRTIADVEVGVPLGRSWILLGRVLPVDYDDLLLAELEPGRRFMERSKTLTFSVWQHERTVEPIDERSCRVTDRLGFELKRGVSWIPGMGRLATAVVGFLFRHRHRRLARWAYTARMPTPREERLVNNEALFRAANERMAAWEEQHAEEPAEPYFCECAEPSCREKVLLHRNEYEQVRSDSLRFFVVAGHEIPDVETVIEEHDGWVVVEKDPEVVDLAVATDPRVDTA
jgi:ligand-binding SRPBCC domain-containing protein